MRTTLKLIGQGRVTIPDHIREELEIETGDLVEVDISRADENSD